MFNLEGCTPILGEVGVVLLLPCQGKLGKVKSSLGLLLKNHDEITPNNMYWTDKH